TKDVPPGATVVGIPARAVPIDTIHYSPGFVPYGTPCGEDVDPSRVGIAELEREVAALRKEVESLKRANLPEPKAKRA
ncbi:MAG: serine acetyltransferase, partial [Sphingomonas sp.]|nr:serine acetyltransferase [Sphingomonas sp.]